MNQMQTEGTKMAFGTTYYSSFFGQKRVAQRLEYIDPLDKR
jgi:hypothetical protein